MAYTAAALTSDENTGLSNDKPMMVLQSANSPTDAHWTTGGTHASADVTESTTPAVRAHDDIGSLVTQTDTASAGTSPKYYNFYFSAGISFDTCIILGHNLNSQSITSLKLQIADDSSFSTNVVNPYVYTVSGSTDNRLTCVNLNTEDSGSYSAAGTAQRYSNVQYARIVIEHAGSKTPKLGEVFLGTRYQLQRNPSLAWNNKDEVSVVSDFTTHSGLTKRYVQYRGQAVRRVSMALAAAAEITTIDNWFNATEEGTKTFAYIETPNTSPQTHLMMLDSPNLRFPLVGPTERALSFSMTEQPPYLSRE